MTDLETRFENEVLAVLGVVADGGWRHRDVVDFVWDGEMSIVSNGDGTSLWSYPSGEPDLVGTFEDVVRAVAERYRDATGFDA